MKTETRLSSILGAAAIVVVTALTPTVSIAHPSPEFYHGKTKLPLGKIFDLIISRAHAMGVELGMEGPMKPKGITVKELGNIDLSKEIPELEGRNMRARFWTMNPGGIVPVHSHADRPAHIYVLSGSVIEHRSDNEQPIVYKPGDISVESNSVVHWWENKGDVIVELLAVDICNAKKDMMAGGC